MHIIKITSAYLIDSASRLKIIRASARAHRSQHTRALFSCALTSIPTHMASNRMEYYSETNQSSLDSKPQMKLLSAWYRVSDAGYTMLIKLVCALCWHSITRAHCPCIINLIVKYCQKPYRIISRNSIEKRNSSTQFNRFHLFWAMGSSRMPAVTEPQRKTE